MSASRLATDSGTNIEKANDSRVFPSSAVKSITCRKKDVHK